jgi:hypothetical protein
LYRIYFFDRIAGFTGFTGFVFLTGFQDLQDLWVGDLDCG